MSKYKPVIKMLIEQNRALSYHPVRLENEEDRLIIGPEWLDAEIVRLATDTEWCIITFRNPKLEHGIFGRRLTYYIVLGNDLHETIADHSDHGVAERIAAHIESSF
jgi:hypothetical protein